MKTRLQYCDLIQQAFKHMLNEQVFVPETNNYDDSESWGDGAFCLFKNEEAYRGEYAPKYVLFQAEGTEDWHFAIEVQTFSGSYMQPEEWDYEESPKGYSTIVECLTEMLKIIFEDNFQDVILAWEMKEIE